VDYWSFPLTTVEEVIITFCDVGCMVENTIEELLIVIAFTRKLLGIVDERPIPCSQSKSLVLFLAQCSIQVSFRR